MIGFQLNTAVIEANAAFQASGKAPSIWIGQLLIDAGLLTVPAGTDVIRWLPPLNTSELEAAEGLAIFKSVLEAL